MPFLAAAMPYIGLATTAVSAYNQVEQGKAAAASGKAEQLMAERAANAEQVMAQQAAAQERKKARYLRSRALAVAGASGAGVSDPTVSDILTGIDTEGEMNALNTLYSGDIRAEQTRAGGAAARREGNARRTAAYTSAFNTAFQGATGFASDNPTFFKKYGGERAQFENGGAFGDSYSEEWMH